MSNPSSGDILAMIQGKKISEVQHDPNSKIILGFSNSKKKLVLQAEADCCSESWFEPLNNVPFLSIIGKKIKKIVSGERIELPDSGKQECDQNTKITMVFDDDSTPDLEFVLRNSSNGYYSGWLELSLLHY